MDTIMKSATDRLTRNADWLNALFLAVVMLCCLTSGANARAESLAPPDFRVLTAVKKFDGAWQYALTFKIQPPRRLRSRHLELTVGSISNSSSDRAFVSLGPVWRFPLTREAAFVDLGFSPTLISRSRFNGRDLGGNVHFTSSISIGARLGRQQTIALALRAQHTSNGGLSDNNPGVDMVGLNVSVNFAGP